MDEELAKWPLGDAIAFLRESPTLRMRANAYTDPMSTVLDAADEVESLRTRLAAVREWCDDSQVWAVSGSYMDGYQAARKDVQRRLDRGEVA